MKKLILIVTLACVVGVAAVPRAAAGDVYAIIGEVTNGHYVDPDMTDRLQQAVIAQLLQTMVFEGAHNKSLGLKGLQAQQDYREFILRSSVSAESLEKIGDVLSREGFIPQMRETDLRRIASAATRQFVSGYMLGKEDRVWDLANELSIKIEDDFLLGRFSMPEFIAEVEGIADALEARVSEIIRTGR